MSGNETINIPINRPANIQVNNTANPLPRPSLFHHSQSSNQVNNKNPSLRNITASIRTPVQRRAWPRFSSTLVEPEAAPQPLHLLFTPRPRTETTKHRLRGWIISVTSREFPVIKRLIAVVVDTAHLHKIPDLTIVTTVTRVLVPRHLAPNSPSTTRVLREPHLLHFPKFRISR